MKPQYYLNTYSTYPLTERIKQIIIGAKKYIKTGNFFFREPGLLEELKAACQRGVVVFILSNLQQENENRFVAGNEFKKEEYDPHIPNLMDLVSIGAHVRCISELHAKFILADGEVGMIMSSNYTIDSLYGNPECGVDLFKDDYNYLEGIFDTIFTHADTRLVGRKKDGYVFKSYSSLIDPMVFQDNESNILLTLAPRNNTTNLSNCNIISLYHEIANIINDAEECVFLAAFSFREIDKLPLIKNALANAASRNLEIYLIYNSKPDRVEKEIYQLQTELSSIKSWGIPKNHAKFLFTEKKGIIFTSNIDAKAGLLNGFELGVRLSEHQYDQCVNSIQEIEQEIKDKKYE